MSVNVERLIDGRDLGYRVAIRAAANRLGELQQAAAERAKAARQL